MASSSSAGGSKRKRAEEEEDSDYVPKSNSGRIWSTKDECTLLDGLKKQPNRSNMGSLFDAVHANLGCQVNKKQLADKVRKLKKKFTDGKSKVDDHVYKLMEQVWGGKEEEEEEEEEEKEEEEEVDDEEEDEVDIVFLRIYPNVRRFLVRMYSCANIRAGVERNTILGLIAEKMEMCLSKEELEDMERGWDRCNLMRVEEGIARMEEMKKQKKLIHKAFNFNFNSS